MAESFCDHCIEESDWPDDWSHWSTCTKCVEAGHTPDDDGLRRECLVCTKAFSDKMAEIEDAMHARLARDGIACVKTEGCHDLATGKVYKVIRDDKADRLRQVRIIDDSGEDCLYPVEFFRSREDA